MEKTGKIRSRLSYELYLKARTMAGNGNMIHRKHNHMHMQATPGINAELAKDLENPITWIPPLDGGGDDETENEDEAPAAVTPGSIIDGELVDFDEYARVERGEVDAADEDNMDVAGNQALVLGTEASRGAEAVCAVLGAIYFGLLAPATGRLPTFSLPFIDCELPQDVGQTVTDDAKKHHLSSAPHCRAP
ncbi:hypothetical protein B0H10DRAFT_1960453 [Mycena sp. CBHHK59/15]|nr:hypothetical protein B0H10DRAFT_1960453 [Mycena sp. CBHHK59/15]